MGVDNGKGNIRMKVTIRKKRSQVYFDEFDRLHLMIVVLPGPYTKGNHPGLKNPRS
jgi:hypothetical protein